MNRMLALSVCLSLVSALGCGSSDTTSGGGGGAGGSTTSSGPPRVEDVRDDRYCEVLLGEVQGTSVHIEVFNTYLLNECPDEAWSALDAAAIKAEQEVDAVILNGPRYWLMDAFENSTLVDTTVVSFGGIEMRLAGELDVPLSEAMGGGEPYTTRTVARNTSWVYEAGKPVFELVDPMGRVFDMQSYSVQTEPQTIDTLADLGSKLTLPEGWMFRSRTLEMDLQVTAVGDLATVVQDDFGNTYQLSQQ